MKTIIDMPDEIDPIAIIQKVKLTCPVCGYKNDSKKHYASTINLDRNGEYHNFFTTLNKYVWKRFYFVTCEKCGCEFDTDWFPADKRMFEIPVKEGRIIMTFDFDNNNYCNVAINDETRYGQEE